MLSDDAAATFSTELPPALDLVNVRARLGVSQRAIAARMPSSVVRWIEREKGRVALSVRFLERLAAAAPDDPAVTARLAWARRQAEQVTTVDYRAARVTLGLTQREMARRVGVSESSWSEYERGRTPHPRARQQIANVLVGMELMTAEWSRKELRRSRLATGLTQRALGRAVGVAPETICRWETTDRQPRLDIRRRLAQVLAPARPGPAHK